MEFGLKWVHMARYELLLKLDGAPRHTIICKTPLTLRKAMEGPTNPKESNKGCLNDPVNSTNQHYEQNRFSFWMFQ